MLFNFANVLIFFGLAIAFVLGVLLFGALLRPKFPEAEKATIYECGERPVGRAWFNFNPRFYIIALIFVVFDVEIAFMYPVATVFKRWVAEGVGWFALVEILVFIGILLVGLAYVWVEGDLAWLKRVKPRPEMDLPTAARHVEHSGDLMTGTGGRQ